MAVVTGLTAARMLEIEASSVVDGDVVGGHLILQKHDGTEIDAGSVVGPVGPQGPAGIAIVAIPGEIRMWPGATLPQVTDYGHWAWANGDVFDEATYPKAAAAIDPAWKTAHGQANPGVGKFRVPDLRGLVPAGPDAMPAGTPRANRITRPDGILQGKSTGEERHVMITQEMPKHTHIFAGNPLPAHGHAGSSFAGDPLPGHYHTTEAEWKASFAATSSSICITNLAGAGPATPGNAVYPATNWVSAGTPTGAVSVATASAGTPSGTNANTGGGGADPVGQGQPHENMQPTVFVPYIVKLDD